MWKKSLLGLFACACAVLSMPSVAKLAPKASAPSAPSFFRAESTPYSGTAANLPGTIEIENFDEGGPGVAYGDATPVNEGGSFRDTDVDLEPASGGGFNLGWTAPLEW